MTARGTTAEKELAHRSSDGIDVALYWNEQTNRVTLTVCDARSAEDFELEVDRASALDAYRHPFAYAGKERTGGKIATGKLAA
jgi:hypothetical protein